MGGAGWAKCGGIRARSDRGPGLQRGVAHADSRFDRPSAGAVRLRQRAIHHLHLLPEPSGRRLPASHRVRGRSAEGMREIRARRRSRMGERHRFPAGALVLEMRAALGPLLPPVGEKSPRGTFGGRSGTAKVEDRPATLLRLRHHGAAPHRLGHAAGAGRGRAIGESRRRRCNRPQTALRRPPPR